MSNQNQYDYDMMKLAAKPPGIGKWEPTYDPDGSVRGAKKVYHVAKGRSPKQPFSMQGELGGHARLAGHVNLHEANQVGDVAGAALARDRIRAGERLEVAGRARHNKQVLRGAAGRLGLAAAGLAGAGALAYGAHRLSKSNQDDYDSRKGR